MERPFRKGGRLSKRKKKEAAKSHRKDKIRLSHETSNGLHKPEKIRKSHETVISLQRSEAHRQETTSLPRSEVRQSNGVVVRSEVRQSKEPGGGGHRVRLQETPTADVRAPTTADFRKRSYKFYLLLKVSGPLVKFR
jgi:hypothetical protein